MLSVFNRSLLFVVIYLFVPMERERLLLLDPSHFDHFALLLAIQILLLQWVYWASWLIKKTVYTQTHERTWHVLVFLFKRYIPYFIRRIKFLIIKTMHIQTDT